MYPAILKRIFYRREIKRIAFVCAMVMFLHPVYAQRVSIYNTDGTPKSSAQISIEEAKLKKDAAALLKKDAAALPASTTTTTTGTSAAFRKEVKDYKKEKKNKIAAAKAKLKSYDEVGPYISIDGGASSLRPVRKDNKWGFVSVTGETYVEDQIPLIYDGQKLGTYEFLAVKKGDKWGFINWIGANPIPFEYDDIISVFGDKNALHTGSAIVVKNGKRFEINKSNEVIGKKTDMLTGKEDEPVPASGNAFAVAKKCGTQEWMAENLNVGNFRNGDAIPEARTKAEWDKAGKEGKPAWSYYENNAGMGDLYGRLYNWYAVSDLRNMAPLGWHIASDEEWQTLITFLGGKEKAAANLKVGKGWNNGSGWNSIEFNAMGGGFRMSDFMFAKRFGCWWTTTSINNETASSYNCRAEQMEMSHENNAKEYGYSVRCIKD